MGQGSGRTILGDRPERSSAPVFELEEKYSGKSRREKLKDLRRFMDKKGGGRVLLASLEDIAWLTNLRGGDVAHTPVFLAFALIDKEKAELYVYDSAFSEAIRETLMADGIGLKSYMDIYKDLADLDGGSLLYDGTKVNYALARSVAENVRVIPVDINQMIPKSVKNETELQNLRNVHIKDGVAMTKFMYWLKTNVGRTPITEMSAADYLLELRKNIDTYLDLSFDTISAYREHGAMMHYRAVPETDVALEAADMLLVDSGGSIMKGRRM